MRPAISGGYSVSVGGRFHQTTQVTHQVLWLKLSINPTVIDLRRQHFFCPPKKREFRLRCFGSQYPSSHNHQSSKMGRSNISFLPFRVIFHFHDYGRKGKSPSFFWWDVVHALWQCLKIHWTERHGFLKVNICNICKLSAIFRILPTEICSVFFSTPKKLRYILHLKCCWMPQGTSAKQKHDGTSEGVRCLSATAGVESSSVGWLWPTKNWASWPVGMLGNIEVWWENLPSRERVHIPPNGKRNIIFKSALGKRICLFPGGYGISIISTAFLGFVSSNICPKGRKNTRHVICGKIMQLQMRVSAFVYHLDPRSTLLLNHLPLAW